MRLTLVLSAFPAGCVSITWMSFWQAYIKGQVFEEDKVPFCIVPGSNYSRVTKSGGLATQPPKVVIDYADGGNRCDFCQTCSG